MGRSGNLDKNLDPKKVKAFAENLTRAAGKLLLRHQIKIKVLKHKDRQDIATDADLASEKLIIEAIKKEFPDHSIISEEIGEVKKNSEYTWVIDPLDGTKEYLRGIPLYNVSILLRRGTNNLLSVVYQPTGDQLFSAVTGGGAFLNGKRLKVSSQGNLADSFVYSYLPLFTGDEEIFNKAWQKLAKLSRQVYRLRSLSALNVCCSWVAMGGCEAFIMLLYPSPICQWDIAPGIFIAREAGAKATDLSGAPLINNFENGIIISNGKIHEKLLEVLNES